MAPRVLVSDELSETAVQIFRDRGVEVDFQPKLGKDKEKLAEIIGNYDGLAIRSATKATEKLIAAASNLKVIGRAGIGVDNVDIPAATFSAFSLLWSSTPIFAPLAAMARAVAAPRPEPPPVMITATSCNCMIETFPWAFLL